MEKNIWNIISDYTNLNITLNSKNIKNIKLIHKLHVVINKLNLSHCKSIIDEVH